MTAQDLKNAILQLAVQGKLVPQDPADEPASELLKRVKVEKAQLIKVGTLKKEKSLPPISGEEIPFDIPENWIWVRMTDIIGLISGQDLKLERYNGMEKGIPYITGASNIENGEVIINRWTESSVATANEGDLLISCKGTVGKMAFLKCKTAHIARQIMAIKFPPSLNPHFIKRFVELSVPGLKREAKSLIPGIARENLLALCVPLPPLTEQARIVTKIEELLPYIEEYDAVEKRLTVLNKKFPDQLRKSILQQAIMGKLTERDPTDEPASELLKRIRTEKVRLIKEGKLKKEKPLSPITADDIPFEVPDGWEWVRLQDAATAIVDCPHSTPKYLDNETGFYAIGTKGMNGDGEITRLFADQDDSYFDKYLNEVLYLFNRADADVIVFEDMDRFNANQIFERLREVNALVNIQRQNKITSKKWSNTVIQYCDKHDNRGVFKLLRNLAQNIEKHSASYTPLRFFYLLRDDIFDTKDRTKFFDYIVPVVPVIDGSNSYEKFDRFLREAGVIEKFDQGFLQGLCLYIDDMRLLKNIYNEFLVYYNRLDKAKPNPNKMMAIITYKNLFPKDFSDLQLGRGFVFALFEQKPSIIRSEIDVAKAKIKALHDRLDAADKEWFKGENEIDFYFDRLDEQIQRQYYYTERERRQNENKAERDRRKQALQDSIQKNREDIERQVKVLEHKILVLQTSWLKDLITRENVAGIFSVTHENEVGTIENFNNIKENNYFNLLKFLIRNGHIDETYQDYMTYFYEGTFTQSDKIFLRRITDRAGAEFTYSLREPQKVIDAPIMREVEFQQEETLNNDLLEFLLLNDTADVYQSYLHILIQQIKEKHRFDFLTQYYNTQKARKEFVVKLNEFWPEFFLLAQRERSISSELVRSFSIDTLCFSDELSLDAINIDNCLTEYISKSADYLAVENPDTPRLIAAFEFLKVCFAKLDYEKSEMGLFKDVYEHHMYELSFENIELMLRAVYFIENSDDIIHKNYTVIRTLPQSALTEYVEENFEAYMALTLEHCSGEIVDDYAVVLLVLNNQMLDRTLKNRYISVLSTVLLDLSDVNDTELWATLIEQEIVAPTVQNLVVYFLQHGLDQSLIFYINRLPENFDFSGLSVMLKKGEDEDDSIALATAIEVCSGISIDKYKAILISLGYSFDSFESTALNDEMLYVLIDEKILKMDADGLTFIRKQHRDHIFDFIQQNIDEYLALQTADVFNLEEAKEIATWGIEDNKIITLLSLSSAPITIVGMNFSDRVSAFILGHNLNENDIASLCLHYSDYGNETRAQTVQVIADYRSTVISYDLELDDALLSELFLRDDITSDDKAKFFSCALPRFNEEICKRHFEELGVSELSYIFVKGSRKKYAKNNIITNLLSALKEHGWIYDFFEDDKNPEKYCIIKNRPRERTD